MSIGSNEEMIGDSGEVKRCASDHSVLQHDAMGANLNRTAFRDDTCAEHDSTVGADPDVSADGGSRRNVCGWVKNGSLTVVREYHSNKLTPDQSPSPGLTPKRTPVAVDFISSNRP